MRRLALIMLTALSACAPVFAEFTSPPWPHGTNYYTAGTNKDNRARQCMQGVAERELVLFGRPAPSITNRFYVYEHDNCAMFKEWIRAHCTNFVDYTRTTSTNITYWTTNTLVGDCGRPSNVWSYTPWQQLNGVGVGYTNSNTHPGYTTLDYTFAAVTDMMKRLTIVTRKGYWITPTNTGNWGHGWALDPSGYVDTSGDATRSDSVKDSTELIYSFWPTYDDAVSAVNERWRGEWNPTNETWTWTTFNDGTIYDDDIGTNIPPVLSASAVVVSNDYVEFGYKADYVAISGHNYAELPSSHWAGWKLYIDAAGPQDVGSDAWVYDPPKIVQFDGYGFEITESLSMCSTGMSFGGGYVMSGVIGLTNSTLPQSYFPTNFSDLAGSPSDVGALTDPDTWFGDIGEGTMSRVGVRGFEVQDWIFVLDYGVTNGFLRK